MANANVHVTSDQPDAAVAAQMRRLSRRAFATGAVAALAGAAGVRWLATRELDDGIPWPLRRMLGLNELIAQGLFGSRGAAPEFAPERAEDLRVNGMVGLASPVQAADWTVQVTGTHERRIPLAAILALPAQEITTEFKCVEGWSRIVRWKGVRLADFLQRFAAPAPYVALTTPLDGVDERGREDRYYVGLDGASAMHPQTLLAYEMNGAPLTLAHGAPLRLVSTVKYGYKSIKRISAITLTDRRPPDYWAARGYDWFAGL